MFAPLRQARAGRPEGAGAAAGRRRGPTLPVPGGGDDQGPRSGKENYVRAIAERDGITKGLICVLATVEPCRSFDVRGNRATQMLEVIRRARRVPDPRPISP